MSEFHFAGHPEIAGLAVPNNATQFDATIADDGTASVWYVTPEGEANLTWSTGGWGGHSGWDGQFETAGGVMEYANDDGSFGDKYAFRLDTGDPVNPADYQFDASATTALSTGLMSLNSADHLFVS